MQASAILLDDAMVTVEVDAVLLHPLLAEVPSGHDVVGTSGVRGHARLPFTCVAVWGLLRK